MIEDDLRSLLLTFDAVTALVGSRIRPDQLGQGDELPAIVIELPDEEHHNDLSGVGGLASATVLITGISEDKTEARAIIEAVRINGTDPGTGLAGFTGGAGDGFIQAAVLERTRQRRVAEDDGSDDGWFEITAQYEIWYEETI